MLRTSGRGSHAVWACLPTPLLISRWSSEAGWGWRICVGCGGNCSLCPLVSLGSLLVSCWERTFLVCVGLWVHGAHDAWERQLYNLLVVGKRAWIPRLESPRPGSPRPTMMALA